MCEPGAITAWMQPVVRLHDLVITGYEALARSLDVAPGMSPSAWLDIADRIERRAELELACLLGCGVTTGWGSSVHAGEIQPGDNVCVIGVGGIGAAAIQGARIAGARNIIAIDPVAEKEELAQKFGATHFAPSIGEAYDLINEVTWGRMCDKVICCVGIGEGEQIAPIMTLCAKRGRVVVTNIHPTSEQSIQVPGAMLTLFEKSIIGSLFGSANIRKDIPRLLELYTQGQLNLDDLVTRTYTLDQVNEGYEAMRNGENIRGVILFD